MKFLVIANCQGSAIQQFLEAVPGNRVKRLVVHRASEEQLTQDFLAGFDVVIAQDIRPDRKELWQAVNAHPHVIQFPWLLFFGLTPDHSTVTSSSGAQGQSQENIPRIMAAAKTRGLTRDQTRALYNPEFVEAMGYRDVFAVNRSIFIETLSAYTPRATYLFEKWFDQGVFFHTGNHPKSFVIIDILREVLQKHDIPLAPARVADYLPDLLARNTMDPNLNHPDAHNLLDRQDHVYKGGGKIFTLEQMIAHTFRLLDAQPELRPSERDLARFDTAYEAWTGRTPEPMRNPYSKGPTQSFWSRAVARPAPEAVRPGTHVKPVIGPETRVATAGSCFAQHVARAMVSDGLNYYVAEPAPEGMSEETAEAHGYGLFSARYGNIYSTRQLLQLIRRAYGRFTPIETAWQVKDGYIDPFRPNIGEIFPSIEALEEARAAHLAKVREMFESLDVFVFTLGLTEGWFDRRDGAAYPVTPGAVTKAADPAHFEFQNHDYTTIKEDLTTFLGDLLAVNPGAKVILTVSPVPLIATYSDKDVLTATTYSKSVLVAVAGDMAAHFGAVQYFPSYEIITGAYNRGAYFGENLREIRPEGVAHVMDVFREKLVHGAETVVKPETAAEADETSRKNIEAEISRQMYVVCDEELLVDDN